ncbi:MAG TPA: hypothetical protein VFA18_08940, partial [Gemmataceae bacterium]|nr:hypothetical protein [Gemmataceae bacterium]
KLDVGSIVQGGNTNLTVKLTRLWPDFKTPLTVQLHPLEGIPNVAVNNGGPMTLNPGKDEVKVPVAVNAQATPGTYNLVLRGTGQIPFNKDPKAKQKPPINVIQPATPVALTVLPKQVATVTVTNPNPAVKAGSQSEVVVRVARQYQYTGPFQVKLVLPKGTTGVAAADITIPAGKDEGRLMLKVPANTPPGNRPNVVVQLTAILPGNVAVVQEAKLNVIVRK